MTHTKYKFNNVIEKNDSDYLNSIINNNIVHNNPWLVDKECFIYDKPTTTSIINDIFNNIGHTIKPKTKKTTITIELHKKNNNISLLDMIDDIINKMQLKDTYDYLLPDGTPVKYYGDRIQVGFNMIPLFKTNDYYFNLGNETKKEIYTLYTIL